MPVLPLFSLPNLLTLLNLFSGCLAVVFVFTYQIHLVPYCVLVSLAADFLDGFAARYTKTSSAIGKELDSLADVVSFGVVPGAIVFWLLSQKLEAGAMANNVGVSLLASPAFIITLFAALRLAKFNTDSRQTENFIGLATPAATVFVTGLLLIFLNNSFGLSRIIFHELFLYSTVILLSVFMIAELPMFAFKFKTFGWEGNQQKYVFIFLSLVLLATFKFAAISIIVILYILFSIVIKFYRK